MPPAVIQPGYGYIGIAKQTVQGTAVAPSDFFLYDTESYKPNIGASFKHTGADQTVAYAIIMKQTPNGSIKIPVTSNTGARMMAYNMGGTDTVTGVADPYAHSLVLAPDLPWLTIERAVGNGTYIERIKDCKLTDFALDAKEADQAWLTFSFTGGSSISGVTAATVVYDADPVFMMRDGTFSLNGTTLATVVGVKIMGKRNIKDRRTVSITPDYLIPTNREFTVALDLLFETTNAVALYNNIVHAGSTSGTTKTPYTGAFIVTLDPAATPDHQMVFSISNLAQIDGLMPLNPSGDAQILSITGTAIRPSVGGNELTVTAKNLTALAFLP